LNHLQVSVWRGGAEGAFQNFEVPRHASQTVLDVVTHIQRALDPTLAYRFACRVGMCGSCAMTVNGVPRWTCRTHIDKAVKNKNEIILEPLRNLPVIRDLVTDMREFFDKWRARRAVSKEKRRARTISRRFLPTAKTGSRWTRDRVHRLRRVLQRLRRRRAKPGLSRARRAKPRLDAAEGRADVPARTGCARWRATRAAMPAIRT